MTSTKPRTTRVGAYGLIVQERKILLCRLSSRLPRDAGSWTRPGGGVEFGEDPLAAMLREVQEETGLSVRSDALAGINSLKLEEAHRDFHGIRVLYHASVVGGSLRNEVDGSTDLCAWWSLEEAHNLPLVDLAEVGLKLAFAQD